MVQVAAAMRRYPELVGGSTNAGSLAMRAVPGLICKDGAEGVWAAALPDGRAFAAKINDGSARLNPREVINRRSVRIDVPKKWQHRVKNFRRARRGRSGSS